MRDRSIITISALVTGQHIEQLEYHLKLAKENGVKEDEITEAITHLAFYVGCQKRHQLLKLLKKFLNNVALSTISKNLAIE